MNLVYGTILEIDAENGLRVGRVRVLGAVKKTPLDLIGDAQAGDQVLLCDNVAIAKVTETTAHKSEFACRAVASAKAGQ